MTIHSSSSITSDPRILGKNRRDSTPLGRSIDQEGNFQFEISELAEKIETLANETGNLRVVVQDRPQKYSIQIHDLGEDSYELLQPLYVLVEEYPNDDLIIASLPEIEVYGDGNTLSIAINHLQNAILDLYDELVECGPLELGELPLRWLSTLKKVIKKRDSL